MVGDARLASAHQQADAGRIPLSDAATDRRKYDNTRRRQQAAETREKIITAGSELLHAAPVRDWQGLTVRAVAERAGVNERTIYRHFETERGLRDAVMHRLEQDAGIDLEGMPLEGIAAMAARTFEHVASFPPAPRPALDPTLTEAKERMHGALIDAVSAHTEGWSAHDRTTVAALFDVLWSVGAYERLVVDWAFDRDRAIEALTWMIDGLGAAVRSGARPGSAA
jgi:AcrR family transcriptional regulator